MRVWMVGRLSDDYEEWRDCFESEEDGTRVLTLRKWVFVGCYATEDLAERVCIADHYFIMNVEVLEETRFTDRIVVRWPRLEAEEAGNKLLGVVDE